MVEVRLTEKGREWAALAATLDTPKHMYPSDVFGPGLVEGESWTAANDILVLLGGYWDTAPTASIVAESLSFDDVLTALIASIDWAGGLVEVAESFRTLVQAGCIDGVEYPERRVLDDCVGMFWALSNDLRVSILRLLLNSPQPLSVAEVVGQVRTHRVTVYHHLRLLVKARLVESARFERTVYYEASRAALFALAERLQKVAKF